MTSSRNRCSSKRITDILMATHHHSRRIAVPQIIWMYTESNNIKFIAVCMLSDNLQLERSINVLLSFLFVYLFLLTEEIWLKVFEPVANLADCKCLFLEIFVMLLSPSNLTFFLYTDILSFVFVLMAAKHVYQEKSFPLTFNYLWICVVIINCSIDCLL